jgi:hypothetical protein
MTNAGVFSDEKIPERNPKNKGKEVTAEGFVTVRGKQFYRRTYADGGTELARTDEKTGMLVHLCFPATQPPEQMGLIKEAIKHNFNPGLLRIG